MASTLYLLVVGNTEVVSSVLEIGTLMHLSSSFMVVEATYIQCRVASYPRASLNARKADNSNSDKDTSTAQQYTEFTVLNSPIWRQGPDWLLIMPHLFISEYRTSCGVASHPIDSLKITKRRTSLGNFSYAEKWKDIISGPLKLNDLLPVLVHRYSLPEDTSVRAMWSSPSNLLTPENWKDIIIGPPKLNDLLPVLKKNQQFIISQLQKPLLLVLQAKGIRSSWRPSTTGLALSSTDMRTLVLVFLCYSLLTRITAWSPLQRMTGPSRTNLAGQGISCSALASRHYQVKISLSQMLHFLIELCYRPHSIINSQDHFKISEK